MTLEKRCSTSLISVTTRYTFSLQQTVKTQTYVKTLMLKWWGPLIHHRGHTKWATGKDALVRFIHIIEAFTLWASNHIEEKSCPWLKYHDENNNTHIHVVAKDWKQSILLSRKLWLSTIGYHGVLKKKWEILLYKEKNIF